MPDSVARAFQVVCQMDDHNPTDKSAVWDYLVENGAEVEAFVADNFRPGQTPVTDPLRLACAIHVLCRVDAKDRLVGWFDALVGSDMDARKASVLRERLVDCFPGPSDALLQRVGAYLPRAERREAATSIRWMLAHYRGNAEAVIWLERYLATAKDAHPSVQAALSELRGD